MVSLCILVYMLNYNDVIKYHMWMSYISIFVVFNSFIHTEYRLQAKTSRTECLHLRFGAAFGLGTAKRHAKLQEKIPSMYSVNALAYFLEASTSHISLATWIKAMSNCQGRFVKETKPDALDNMVYMGSKLISNMSSLLVVVLYTSVRFDIG